MKIQTKATDFIWSYLAYILKFGANLIIIPLILQSLSKEEYGLWVTFTSLGVIVNLFDFGFSSTIMRNLTYVWSGANQLLPEGFKASANDNQRNDRLFALTLKTCKYIYLGIGFSAIAISLSIGTFYVKQIINSFYDPKLIIAWVIYGINIGINLIYAYWPVALRSVGAIKDAQIATVLGFSVQLLISFVGIKLGYGIIVLSIAGCVCGLVIRIYSVIKLKRYQGIGGILKEYNRFNKEEIKKTISIVWHNAKKAGVSSIATVSMAQCTTILCSYVLGVAVSAELGICVTLMTTLSAVSQIYYQTIIPQITQSKQQANKEGCKNSFTMAVLIANLCYIVCFGILLLFGQPMISIIKSKTNLNLMILAMVGLYTWGEMNYSMHASYISLSNTLPFVRSVIITAIAVVIFSTIGMLTGIGIYGLLAVRIVVEFAYIVWKWPLAARQELGVTIREFITCGVSNIWNLLRKFKTKR